MLQSLTPILIASPVHRSGTTLLQRLLCSTPNTLIFGETLANDMTFYFSMLHNKQMLLGGEDNWRAQQLEKVLNGDVNDWIPDIMPDKDWLLSRSEQTIYEYLKGFADYAQQHGRPLWGTKLPAWQPGMIRVLLNSMPKSKLLYIVRDLKSCVRSAKLIGYCHTAADVQQYAQMWLANLQAISTYIPKESLLYIDYQRLCEQPGQVIDEIENFTDAQPIDRSVMQYRINNYDRKRDTPPELNTDEQTIVERYQALLT
ncbi:MAG: sulfotransferase [Chitinophagales bacterium]|nr:sulfotransferase [Chitinophagales bacterium]